MENLAIFNKAGFLQPTTLSNEDSNKDAFPRILFASVFTTATYNHNHEQQLLTATHGHILVTSKKFSIYRNLLYFFFVESLCN